MKKDKKPLVSLAKNVDHQKAVKDALNNLNLPNLNGKKILLKPNVGREVAPNLGINTNPEVVKAVFEYLKDLFKAKFFIGDSPIINTNTREAFKQSGYSNLLEAKDLTFIDLDERSPIDLEIPNGELLKKIKITGFLGEFDYIISIPVLKMHMHCGASLSLKNLKGLIYRDNKRLLHHYQNQKLVDKYKVFCKKVKELDIAIADYVQYIKPDLAIIDASYALGGMGPSSGEKVRLDTIIASKSGLAADIIALTITRPDWSLQDVPHLRILSERVQNSPKSPKNIRTIPKKIEHFIYQLDPPPESISIKYENVRLIDIDSCSACLSTVFQLLKENKDFIDKHFTKDKPLNLAIGKGITSSDLYENTFLIGNCTYHTHENGIFIKGCAPVESV
ncbi:MAG: DUF362 domain-containing protein, partial [Promethearchaeota archaeon]